MSETKEFFLSTTAVLIKAGIKLIKDPNNYAVLDSGDVVDLITCCVKPLLTSVETVRFKRTMDAVSSQLETAGVLADETRADFFKWFNKDEYHKGLFHDAVKTSLNTNSKLAQIVLGLIISESFTKYNISYTTSVLLRAFDGLDDFELNLFLDYFEIYDQRLILLDHKIGVISKYYNVLAIQMNSNPIDTMKLIAKNFEFLASKRLLTSKGSEAIGKIGSSEYFINEYTLEAIRLLRLAKSLETSLSS